MDPADRNRVGIIGAGRLGQAMARTALRAGHSVVIANSRGPGSLTAVVSTLGAGASAGTVAPASAAGVVVISVPWARVPEAVQGLEWNGQIVIDATNDFDPSDLDGRTSSELVANRVGGARVVKAANTLGAAVLGADPTRQGPASDLCLRRRRRCEVRSDRAVPGRRLRRHRPRRPHQRRRDAADSRSAGRRQPDPTSLSRRAAASGDSRNGRGDFGISTNIPMDGGGVVIGDRIQVFLEIEAALNPPGPASP